MEKSGLILPSSEGKRIFSFPKPMELKDKKGTWSFLAQTPHLRDAKTESSEAVLPVSAAAPSLLPAPGPGKVLCYFSVPGR